MNQTVCVLCGIALLAPMSPVRSSNLVRILILDGQSAGPYHDWQHITPVLKKELEETGMFQVEVMTAPPSAGDFSNFKPNFRRFQAVVMNYDGQNWPPELRASWESFIRDGGGLVIVHASDNAFPDWQAFNQMIGVGGWRGRTETAGPLWYLKNDRLVSDDTPGPAGSHGARLPFAIRAREPEHPILKGLPKTWMHAPDELYASLRGPGENMTILATAHSDAANQGTGREEPILMIVNYGKGRVFHTTLGHDIPALSCVGFITTFQRGTEWSATGKVTQKIPATFPPADTVSYRADIAAMNPNSPASRSTRAPPVR